MRASPIVHSMLPVASKTLVILAGTAAEVVAGWKRLKFAEDCQRLRVIVPAEVFGELTNLAAIPPRHLWAYTGVNSVWLWLRAWKFLGFSERAEIICASSRKQFRLLKLLAFSLRGRVSFCAGDGARVAISIPKWLAARVHSLIAARGPVCVIGSASPEVLSHIVADLRCRHAGVPLLGILPAWLPRSTQELFDSRVLAEAFSLGLYAKLSARCLGRKRFYKIVVPWTEEAFGAWKSLPWFLPLRSVEVYNDNRDVFSGRSLLALLRHWNWRRWQARERFRRTLPVGVVGSASSFYLGKIIPVLRRRYPGARLHGLLPASLQATAAHFFDSTTILPRGGGALPRIVTTLRLRSRFQCWIVPCTKEHYTALKLLACLLPRRQVYNELADGFPVRNWRTLYKHIRWRLRDHLSFQIVSAAAGNGRAKLLMHLVCYGPRLLAALPFLFQARVRSKASGRVKALPQLAKRKPRVDVVLFGNAADGNQAPVSFPFQNDAVFRHVQIPEDTKQFQSLNTAIQDSDAEFVCLLERGCTFASAAWLEQLLESFQDQVAQVGPQVASPDGKLVVRGLVLDSQNVLRWNADHKVRWYVSPDWLEVDALPVFCLLLRRSAILEVGGFRDASGLQKWGDEDLSRRLAARGWRSLCNQAVTIAHPDVYALAASSQCEGVLW